MVFVLQMHTRCQKNVLLSKIQTKTSLLLCVLFCLGVSYDAYAYCLLGLEPAHTLKQGNVSTSLALFGSADGLSSSLQGRLGLREQGELHVRTGICSLSYSNVAQQKVELVAHTLQAGTRWMLLSHRKSVIDLSVAMSLYMLQGDDGHIRGNAFSSVGFTPYLMVGYPFPIAPQRSAFVALSLGGSMAFNDQNYGASDYDFYALTALSAGVDILSHWSVITELRLHQSFYGGGALAFRF